MKIAPDASTACFPPACLPVCPCPPCCPPPLMLKPSLPPGPPLEPSLPSPCPCSPYSRYPPPPGASDRGPQGLCGHHQRGGHPGSGPGGDAGARGGEASTKPGPPRLMRCCCQLHVPLHMRGDANMPCSQHDHIIRGMTAAAGGEI